MKTFALALSTVLAATFAFTAAALPKTKAQPQQAQYSGPRQFIQSVALSNGVGATITVVADQSEESRVSGIIGQTLSELSRVDLAANGAGEGEIAKINALTKGQQITLSDEVFNFIAKARELAEQTKGWFDITHSEAGGWFSANNYRKVSLNGETKTLSFKADGMQIEVSTIWPAYLADLAMTKATAEGLTDVKIEIGNVSRNVGQDIYTPWKVAVNIPNPNSQNAYRAYEYSFANKAVATLTPEKLNGTTLIDPRNNQPVSNNFRNVTVFGGDSMTASAFAVALYTLGPKDARAFAEDHPEVKGIFVDDAGQLSSSRELTITHKNYATEEQPAVTVDRGPNDVKQKQREEAKE